MAKPASRNAFLFIVVTVTIDMMGFGLIMPVMPALLSELAGLPVEQAAPYGGYLSACYALLNFIAAPLLIYLGVGENRGSEDDKPSKP